MIDRELIARFEGHLKTVLAHQSPETVARIESHLGELAELIAHTYDLGIDESMPDRVRGLLLRCWGANSNPRLNEPAEVTSLVGVIVRESIRWWRNENLLGRWSSGHEQSYWLG